MSTLTRIALIVLLTASSFAVSAQQPSTTGTIAGVVVTDEMPGNAVPRATVVLTGGGLAYERAAITDGSGRFSFSGLPGGRFTLTASKAAFITTAYGAKRPGRPGTPFTLASGESVNLTLRLTRGAIVMGTIRDHVGDPAPGVTVMAISADQAGARGQSDTTTEWTATTDDRGGYRIYGLPPGAYTVVANAPSGDVMRLTPAQIDTLLSQLQGASRGQRAAAPGGLSTFSAAPIYFPGTPLATEAERISLAAGEERSVDIASQLVRTAAIEGVVVTGGGVASPPIGVVLGQDGPAAPAGLSSFGRFGRAVQADADGKFRFAGVAPGRYVVTARSVSPSALPARGGGSSMQTSMGGPPPNPTDVPLLFATADVSVTGNDVTGVQLLLQPGMTVRGRVVFDAGTATPPADLTGIRVRLLPPDAPRETVTLNGITVTRFAIPAAPVRADGTFEIAGVMPGTYQITTTGVGPSWWLRSAVVNGRDVLDTPVDIAQGADVPGAVVTFTDKRNILNGTLQSASGAPAPEFFVVVFPTERTFWRPASRRIQSTRPGTDGTFTIRDLPAGEYFVAALTDVDASDLAKSSFLEEIVAASLRITIADGETKTQDLRMR